jgi:ankyrin repeat protein
MRQWIETPPPMRPATPFIKAARVGHVDVIHMQLAAGMDVNTVDENGVGALYVAAREGNVDVIHVLLLHEANKNEATKKGNVTALYAACSRGHIHAVRMLLDADADTEIAAQTGSTPLYIARLGTMTFFPPYFPSC